MKSIIRLIIFALVLIVFSPSLHARPFKGFNVGPYLTLETGIMQTDYDTDQVTGGKVGRNYEPSFGFLFGWNIIDELSFELQGRYATNIFTDGKRVQLVSVNTYCKGFLVTDFLTDFKTLRILPFAKAGMSVRAGVIPGTPNGSKDTVNQVGYGPSAGVGVAFLMFKYFYFGIDLQEDMLFFEEIRQTVNSVPNTLVYTGGFHPSFNAMVFVGVHY